MIKTCKSAFVSDTYDIEIEGAVYTCNYMTARKKAQIFGKLVDLQNAGNGVISAIDFFNNQIDTVIAVLTKWSHDLELTPENIETLKSGVIGKIYTEIMTKEGAEVESEAKN